MNKPVFSFPRIKTLVIVFAGILLLFSCNRKALIIRDSTEPCRVSRTAYLYDSLLMVSKGSYDSVKCNNLLKSRFSERAIRIADNMHIKPLLCEYAQKEKEGNLNDIAFLRIKLEIQQRINTALLDVNSTQAELICERERIEELSDYLSGWINRKVNNATVNAIIIGGVTTIIGGIIAVNEGSSISEQGTVIAGAVAASYLSFKSMAVKKKIVYEHPRNHLLPFFEKNNNQHIYSPFLWHFMTKPFRRNDIETNGVKIVLDEWIEQSLPVDVNDKSYQEKIRLFTGNGGEYNVDDLESRLKMYDIINEEIILVNYELKRLQEELLIGYKP